MSDDDKSPTKEWSHIETPSTPPKTPNDNGLLVVFPVRAPKPELQEAPPADDLL